MRGYALASLLNTFTLPVFLLSGITLPLTLAPPIIQTLARLNPFSYAVNTERSLFNGDLVNVAVSEGFIIMGVLALLALVWATRSFQHATA